MKIFCEHVSRQQRWRAYRHGIAAMPVWMEELKAEIVERVQELHVPCEKLLLLGIEGTWIQPHILSHVKPQHITVIDTVNLPGVDHVVEGEMLSLSEQTFDWIIAPTWLQLINDLPGVLIQLRRALKPNGVFLASMLGESSLSELRQAALQADTVVHEGAAPRVGPTVTIQDAAALLQRAGFNYPVVDLDQRRYPYPDLTELYKDLRKVGWGNCLKERRKLCEQRRFLEAIKTHYPTNTRNQYPVTFDWLHLFGRA